MERFFSPNICIPVLKASFPETILRKLLSPLQANIIALLDGNVTLGELSNILGQSIADVENEIRKLIALDIVLVCERASSPAIAPNPPAKVYAPAVAAHGIQSKLHDSHVPHLAPTLAKRTIDPSLSDSCPVVVGQMLEDVLEFTEFSPPPQPHPLRVSSSVLSKPSMDALTELHHLEQNAAGWLGASLPMSLELQLDWTNPESCSSLQLNAPPSGSKSQYDALQPSREVMEPTFAPSPAPHHHFVGQKHSPPPAPISPTPTSELSLMYEQDEPRPGCTDEVNTFPEPPHRQGMASSPDKEPWHRRWLFMDAANRVTLPSAHTAKERKPCPSAKK